jgi:hypothetical protein
MTAAAETGRNLSYEELREVAVANARAELEARPRLTPTERLHEVTMAAMQRRPSEPECAVEISRNAKGAFQFAVTVRGPDVNACQAQAQATADDLAKRYPYEAQAQAQATADDLAKRYPYENGGTA